MPFSELRGWEPKRVGQRSYKKSERVWFVRIHQAGSLHCVCTGPLRKNVKGINIHPSGHKAARSGDSHPRPPPEVKIARKGLRKVKVKARKKKHYYRRRLLPFRPAGQRRKSPQESCPTSVTQMLPFRSSWQKCEVSHHPLRQTGVSYMLGVRKGVLSQSSGRVEKCYDLIYNPKEDVEVLEFH